jgi:hypothetical protein
VRLWDLNRVFRFFGFVLVVTTGDHVTLHFEWRSTFDSRPKMRDADFDIEPFI